MWVRGRASHRPRHTRPLRAKHGVLHREGVVFELGPVEVRLGVAAVFGVGLQLGLLGLLGLLHGRGGLALQLLEQLFACTPVLARQVRHDGVEGQHNKEVLQARQQGANLKVRPRVMLRPGKHVGGHDEQPDDAQVVELEIDQRQHKPIFTVLCVIACTVMFLVSLSKNGWRVAPLSVNPMLGPDSSVLASLGAKISWRIVDNGEWWRLIAPMFLHAGLFHLLVNMLMLWRLGANLEAAFGPVRVFSIYFLSGCFGVMMSAIFLPAVMGVGASGAIYGLVGALFGDYYHNHQYIRDGKHCYLLQLIFSSLLGLVVGLFPLLDNFGHMGGLICGILSSLVFLSGAIKDPRTSKVNYKSRAVLIAFALLIIIFLLGFAVLYSSPSTEWCRWCIHLACLDVGWWNCNAAFCQTVTLTYPNGTSVTQCNPI